MLMSSHITKDGEHALTEDSKYILAIIGKHQPTDDIANALTWVGEFALTDGGEHAVMGGSKHAVAKEDKGALT